MKAQIFKHNLKSPIKQIRENSKTKGYYWLLFNYGNIFRKSTEDQFYRNIELVRLENPNYKIKNWDINQKIIVSIPEIWSLLYPLGTIFNDKGLPLPYPKKVIPQELYEYDIILSNHTNYQNNSYNEILKNSRFPKPLSNNSSSNPYFLYGSKSIQYIIPIDVIKRTFYYHSYKGIETILKRKLEESLKCIYYTYDKSIIIYDQDYLKMKDILSISKYLFRNKYSSKSKSGISQLILDVNNFYARLLQGSNNNDIHFKLPFTEPIKIKVLGQFITDYTTIGDKKFLVYAILRYESLRNDRSLFATRSIEAYDKNDKVSTAVRNLKEEKISKSRVGNINSSNSIEVDAQSDTNSSISSLDLEARINVTCGENINIEFIHRKDQKYKYRTNKSLLVYLVLVLIVKVILLHL